MRRWVHMAMVTVALAGAGGCIIPDTGIQARGESVNPGPVRLVQATALTSSADEECNDVLNRQSGACPMVPITLPFGVIDEGLCVCPSPQIDQHALRYFDIYVEDPDVDEDGGPLDAIFGVFLLDLPPDTDDPSSYVAYESLLSPTSAAAPAQFGLGGYTDAIDRPEPLVRRWTIGDEGTPVDLCNDNASSPDAVLEPNKLHSLRLLVTDRPWYRPFQYDSNGEIATDPKTKKQLRVPAEEAAIGVPDTPGGASYASADYVFRCGDGSADPPDPECQCEEPMEAPQ